MVGASSFASTKNGKSTLKRERGPIIPPFAALAHRSKAASFSMWRRCSSNVVAPMHCSSPRASAGLSRLPMSRPPPPPRLAEPAPTSVWTSSMLLLRLFVCVWF